MAILRPLLGFAVLMAGALTALVMLASEECSEGVADALMAFVLVLPLNLIGMALLGWKPNRLAVLAAALVPAIVASGYTQIAWLLATGTPSCAITTGLSVWEPSGEEAAQAVGWGLSALIFWIGLATALAGGYRRADDRDDRPHR